MVKPNKIRLLFGLYLLVLVVIGEVALHLLHVPSWPAFIAMVFFFFAERDSKKIPNILAGGTFGILSMYLAIGLIIVLIKYLLIPVLKLEYNTALFIGIVIFIVIFVYAIIGLGETFPIILNNFAFMAMLMTSVYNKITEPEPALAIWKISLIYLVAGAAMIYGILLIVKIMTIQLTPRALK